MITDVIVRIIIPNTNEEAWTGNKEKKTKSYVDISPDSSV